ncbi:hypothetical protein [Maritimibacter sp. HL-12]|jgi:hypothetical protein|uniref:hypothetical protein n=1 Tax=Maritimibacter sp. HL-12 TaxID=1162418 RepID=UPI000A0F1DC5|nr:hypothetical protein [Maritimibacter sp. HL-12]SMH45626.1 hypothetical protein SAMN05661107_1625 [Maritimibacter sp. HL-12]
MDVLLHITSPDAARIGASLGRALSEQGASWGCFLTNDGVKALVDPAFAVASKNAARVAVCEHSWDLHMAGLDCPVERGSQTVNSALMAEAGRVISL